MRNTLGYEAQNVRPEDLEPPKNPHQHTLKENDEPWRQFLIDDENFEPATVAEAWLQQRIAVLRGMMVTQEMNSKDPAALETLHEVMGA